MIPRDNKIPRTGMHGQVAREVMIEFGVKAWAMRRGGMRMVDIQHAFGIGETMLSRLIHIGRELDLHRDCADPGFCKGCPGCKGVIW